MATTNQPDIAEESVVEESTGTSTSQTVDLSERESDEAVRRTGLRAAVVFESVRREGEVELQRPPVALAFSGLAAGFSMTLSLIVVGLIRAALPDAPWSPLVYNLGYTVGFLATILGRQQLFTENTVTAVIPLLDDARDHQKWIRVVRLWAVVLVSNLAGAALLVDLIVHSGVFDDATRHAFLLTGLHALALPAGTTFIKALFAGWLIALMVWLLPAAEGSRVLVISIVTYVVGLGGLSHIIAGSAESFYAVIAGAVPWSRYFLDFLLPVFLGNSLGGVLLVSVLNYAQVAVKSDEEKPGE
jgi:formate/nitrite transporter FocA (FNT family)